VRASLVALAVVALVAGCGTSKRGAPEQGAGSLEALWKGSGQSVALIPGTSDYSPGDLRISFLVVDSRARVIAPPTARFWIGRSLSAKPFASTVARLEPVGIRGVSVDDDVKALYVARVRVPEPGDYYVVARPQGRVRIAGLYKVTVKAKSATPAVGSRAYPSRTPTLADVGGRAEKLTTRVPPDRQLLRYSIADSLAARVPFVVTFSTPRFCTSRTCGPVVDVVNDVRTRWPRIRFIHVEIYRDNNPRKGANRWVKQWRLPNEPWTFLVGRDGRIKAKFAGSVSVRELEDAIRELLR
jgi:hypothetical protein